MIKKTVLLIFAGVFLFLVSGCETVKGAADGAQKDLQNAKKTDEWMRDNLW
ncbi:MAG: hypothetical protein PHC33_05575 [Candidatus Omnitrophica bacterium]|nr:hypothetical protein [Candidatus Omnitrophota bacterium]